jgi:hypothetical protein
MAITEKEVEESVSYLQITAEQSARARANRIVLEHGLKRIKALGMMAHKGLPVTAQEREAYASPEYETALDGLRQAVFEDERHKALRTAHEAKIEAWRTAEATRRSVRL